MCLDVFNEGERDVFSNRTIFDHLYPDFNGVLIMKKAITTIRYRHRMLKVYDNKVTWGDGSFAADVQTAMQCVDDELLGEVVTIEIHGQLVEVARYKAQTKLPRQRCRAKGATLVSAPTTGQGSKTRPGPKGR